MEDNAVVNAAIFIVIVLSTVCFVLETEAMIPGALLYGTSAFQVFADIELVSVIIFSIEYVLRFACGPWQRWGWLRFLFNFNKCPSYACK